MFNHNPLCHMGYFAVTQDNSFSARFHCATTLWYLYNRTGSLMQVRAAQAHAFWAGVGHEFC